MKKLTRLQRYAAYCIMLAEMEFGYKRLCYLCQDVFDIDLDDDYRFGNLKLLFPELWKNRGWLGGIIREDGEAFLWGNSRERIEALKQRIIETHPK